MTEKVTTIPAVQDLDMLCGEHAHYVERTGDPLCQQLKIFVGGNKNFNSLMFAYT
jgi:hypothetical protein